MSIPLHSDESESVASAREPTLPVNHVQLCGKWSRDSQSYSIRPFPNCFLALKRTLQLNRSRQTPEPCVCSADRAPALGSDRPGLDFYENQITAQQPIKVHFLPLFVLCFEEQPECSAATMHSMTTQASSNSALKHVLFLREDSWKTGHYFGNAS